MHQYIEGQNIFLIASIYFVVFGYYFYVLQPIIKSNQLSENQFEIRINIYLYTLISFIIPFVIINIYAIVVEN